MALVVKNLPANTGEVKDAGSMPGLGRPPGGGHGNPLQYSCLENPMDQGAWQTTVHGVARVGHGLATKLLLRGDMEGHGTPAGAGGSSQLPRAVRPLREEGPSSLVVTLSSLPPFC